MESHRTRRSKAIVLTIAIWLLATGTFKLAFFNATSAAVLRHWIIPDPYHELAILYHAGSSIVLGGLLLFPMRGISEITALSATAILWAISLIYGFAVAIRVGFAPNCGCLGGAIIMPLWVSIPLDVSLFTMVVFALSKYKRVVSHV